MSKALFGNCLYLLLKLNCNAIQVQETLHYMLLTQKSNHQLLRVQGHQPPLRQWVSKMQPETIYSKWFARFISRQRAQMKFAINFNDLKGKIKRSKVKQ